MNPYFPCHHGAEKHSCIMHDPKRGTLCKMLPGWLTALQLHLLTYILVDIFLLFKYSTQCLFCFENVKIECIEQ